MVRLGEILARVEGRARIVAVSKYMTDEQVGVLCGLGQCDFGENYVQNLARRSEAFSNLKWHFIGRLQRNKIRQLVAAKPVLWQSCESVETALEVEARLDYTLEVLLQLNSAGEASKQGFSAEGEEAVEAFLRLREECKWLRPVGVMSIGAHTDDVASVRRSFEASFSVYERLVKHGASICSMGMSSDYELALACGSNMIRVGSAMFG